MTGRRVGVFAAAALAAVAIGGLAQAYVWRWGIDGLTTTTNSQFGWMLLCFLVSWRWARGRVRSGILAGALTGFGLIASYYLVQWLADDWHAAASQFTGSFGVAWTLAAIGGGALVGLLGALAGSADRARPLRKSVGIATAALVVGLGPVLWYLVRGRTLSTNGIWVAIVFYGAVGLTLAVIGLRQCGAASFVRGLLVGASASVAVLAGLLVLQGTVLYTTF
jgi:hypothetical protein